MKRSFAAWMIVCFAAQTLVAQDDPTKSKWTAEKIENPPAREIKFEHSDEPLEMKLSRPDPKLFEQKFVAKFRLALPELRREGEAHQFTKQRDGVSLDRFGHSRFSNPQSRLAPDEVIYFKRDVERMLKLMPEKLRLDADEVAFIYGESHLFSTRGQAAYSDFAGFRGEQVTANNYREFQILAPTQESAEQRVKSLLFLLDQGMFRPIQQATWKQRAAEAEAYVTAKKRIEELESEHAKLKERVAEYADFTADMLPGIRLQQTQLDINLADIKARLVACDKLLEKGNTKEVQQHIEETKIACAIELAGLEAGRAKSEDLMSKVKASIELTTKRDQTVGSLSGLRAQLHQRRRNLNSLEQDLDDFGPRPIVDAKVVIRPLAWTQ